MIAASTGTSFILCIFLAELPVEIITFSPIPAPTESKATILLLSSVFTIKNFKPSVEDCVTLKEEVNNGVNNTNSKADDFAEIARMIVKILKNDYGIQDEKKIMQVIKIIKEVLK